MEIIDAFRPRRSGQRHGTQAKGEQKGRFYPVQAGFCAAYLGNRVHFRDYSKFSHAVSSPSSLFDAPKLPSIRQDSYRSPRIRAWLSPSKVKINRGSTKNQSKTQ